MLTYEEPLFRPPAEADSLILQVTRGCPHNTCTFCPMYKSIIYREKSLDDIHTEIEYASIAYPDARRIFLADADAIYMDFDKLHAILAKLNDRFRLLNRVNSYANASSILRFSQNQLEVLYKLKLNTLYIGLETGDQDLLKRVLKKESVNDNIKAVQLIQSTGMKASVMVLLGLGGRKYSLSHAEKSAEAINQMQPRILSFLRYVVSILGIKPYTDYVPCTEYEIVLEMKQIVERLELNRTVFRANHSSNPIPLNARFPADKTRLIGEINFLLDYGELDKKGCGRIPVWL